MKPPVDLPTKLPFLTLYTNTFQRPDALLRNLRSVRRQTRADIVEQIVIPDHVGYGLANALYGRVPWYAYACRGEYIVFLSDDDVLATDTVVEELFAAAAACDWPDLMTVRVRKDDMEFPKHRLAAPVEGEVDLGSYVIQKRLWIAYQNEFGLHYSGDVDYAQALWRGGHIPVPVDLLFATGPLGNGRPEVEWR